jgi:hypothetical protein
VAPSRGGYMHYSAKFDLMWFLRGRISNILNRNQHSIIIDVGVNAIAVDVDNSHSSVVGESGLKYK